MRNLEKKRHRTAGFAPATRRSAERGVTGPVGRSAENGFTPPVRRSAENGFTPPVRRSAENGFTLVELMVVIVIIGLLAAIVTFNVLPAGDKGKITKAKSDISTIEGALEMYRLQMNSYPTTSQGLQALVTAPAGVNAAEYQRGGYIKKLPPDPWGRPYLYASPGQHGEADVWSLGADGKDGGEGVNADIASWE